MLFSLEIALLITMQYYMHYIRYISCIHSIHFHHYISTPYIHLSLFVYKYIYYIYIFINIYIYLIIYIHNIPIVLFGLLCWYPSTFFIFEAPRIGAISSKTSTAACFPPWSQGRQADSVHGTGAMNFCGGMGKSQRHN